MPIRLPCLTDFAAALHLPAQRRLLRTQALVDAMPCIATLVELLPPTQLGGQQQEQQQEKQEGQHQEGQQAAQVLTGRVLLQNKQSVDYWGKLSRQAATGVQGSSAGEGCWAAGQGSRGKQAFCVAAPQGLQGNWVLPCCRHCCEPHLQVA